MHERGAVGPGPHADAEVGVEPPGDLTRTHLAHVERHHAAAALRVAPAVQPHAGHPRDALLEAPHQCALVGGNPVETRRAHERHARRQARDAMAVEGAGLQVLGHGRGVLLVVAVGARPTHLERRHVDALGDREPPGPLGPEEALVPGEAHDVEPLRRHIDWLETRGLGGVDDQQRPVLVGNLRQGGDVVEVAREVGRVRHGEHARAGAHERPDGVEVERAVGRDGRDVEGDPLRPQPVERPQHRVVRRRRRDRVVAGAQKAGERGVERLRRVRRKRDLRRRRRPQQLREPVSRPVDLHRGRHRRLVHTAPHAAKRPQGV